MNRQFSYPNSNLPPFETVRKGEKKHVHFLIEGSNIKGFLLLWKEESNSTFRKGIEKHRIKRSANSKSRLKGTNFGTTEFGSPIRGIFLIASSTEERERTIGERSAPSQIAAFQRSETGFPHTSFSLPLPLYPSSIVSLFCTHARTHACPRHLFTPSHPPSSCRRLVLPFYHVVSTVGGYYVQVMANICHVLSPARILSTEN